MKILGIDILHSDKVLFPKSGLTKGDLVQYYKDIASYMLPILTHRPITLKRYPQGIAVDGFFSKHIPEYYPNFISRVNVPMRTKETSMKMVGITKAKDLIFLGSQDIIELHISLSTTVNLEFPDQIVFDFDPSTGFDKVRLAALKLKELLDSINLPAFLKTSGSKGVHVHIPLKPARPFSDIKPFAKAMAQILQKHIPDITTLEQRKDKRGDKVFIDILRNDYGMTVVAPYSPRAIEYAPIAMPIDWSMLEDKMLHAQSFTINNVFDHLEDNPWQDFFHKAVSYNQMSKAIRELY